MDDEAHMNIDETQNFPKDNDDSETVSQEQTELLVVNPATENQILPSADEHSLEYECLPSTSSGKTSLPDTKTFSKIIGDFNQTDDTASNPNIFITSQELRSRTKCSRIADAAISPLLNVKASSLPDLQLVDDATNFDRRGRSSLRGKRNAQFTTPSERAPNCIFISYSKNVKNTNLLSPVAQSDEIVPESTSIKRMKKTPESDSGEYKSCGSELRSSAAAKTLLKSPTNKQIQEMEVTTSKNVESEYNATPSLPSKRQRKGTKIPSDEFSTRHFSCQLNSQSSSDDNLDDESPAILQVQELKVELTTVEALGSVTEEILSIPFHEHQPTNSQFSIKSCDPNDLHLSKSVLNLPVDEDESTINSIVSTHTSTNTGQQEALKKREDTSIPSSKETHSSSNEEQTTTTDISDKSMSIYFPSTEPITVDHSKILDVALSMGNDSGKQKETRSDSEVQPHLLVNEPESGLHPQTNRTPSSNIQPLSDLEDSTAKDIESCIILVSEISKKTDLTVETQGSIASRSRSKILNPHLSRSCHLPLESNFSITNDPSRVSNTTIDRTNENEWTDTNRLDSASRSILQHQISLDRNLPQVRVLRDEFNCPVRSQPNEASTSKMMPEKTKDLARMTCVVRPVQKSFTSSTNTAYATNPQGFGTQSEQSNQLQIGIIENFPSNEMTQEFGTQSDQLNQLQIGTVENFPSDETSTPRDYTVERNYNDLLRQWTHIMSNLDGTSTLRNDINPPHIDVFEGEASTSNYQPLITENSSFDLATFLNRFRFSRDNNPLYLNVDDNERSGLGHQSLFMGGSSSESSSIGSQLTDLVSEFGDDWLPSFVFQAHLLFASVLRDLMLYNEENERWREFSDLFHCFLKSFSDEDRAQIRFKLEGYLEERACNSLIQIRFAPGGIVQNFLIFYYDWMITIVLKTLLATIYFWSNFDSFVYFYQDFRQMYTSYTQFFEINSIESVRNEASRNHLKTLKSTMQRCFLVILMAFRFLFMSVGEYGNEEALKSYEEKLRPEDKEYLRKNRD